MISCVSTPVPRRPLGFARFLLLHLALFLLVVPLLRAEHVELVSTDGSTIKGEVVGFYGGVVYVETRGDRTRAIPYSDLTDESREPVQKWMKAWLEDLVAEEKTVAESDSELSQFLAENLVRFDSEAGLIDYEFAAEEEPMFYAFYYSAHWCGPCRRFTPELVLFYKAMQLVGRDDFEVIFVSSDTGKSKMRQYMEEDEMPWPAVAFNKRSKSIVSKYKGDGIPCLVITDRYGHTLAHSYQGDDYLGPRAPKDVLGKLLSYVEAIRDRLDQRRESSDTQAAGEPS